MCVQSFLDTCLAHLKFCLEQFHTLLHLDVLRKHFIRRDTLAKGHLGKKSLISITFLAFIHPLTSLNKSQNS